MGTAYRFLYANKNRSEHLVKPSLSSEAPADIKDDRPPPPTPLPPSALMCKKPSMLLSVLSRAKTGPGRGDETNSSLKGICFISKDFVMTGRAGTQGKPSHALVEMYTQTIKTVIIVAHFSLRGITQSSTAKRALEIQSRSERERKNERLPNVRRATELEACTFSERCRISTLMLKERLHGTMLIQEQRNH